MYEIDVPAVLPYQRYETGQTFTKIDCRRIQDHSRSSVLSTVDRLLILQYVPISYFFSEILHFDLQQKAEISYIEIWIEITIFPTPHVFDATVGMTSLELHKNL